MDVYANLDQTHFANLIFLVTFDPSQDYSNFTPRVQLIAAVTNDQPILDCFYQAAEFTYQPFEPQTLFIESIPNGTISLYALKISDPLSDASFRRSPCCHRHANWHV